MSLPFLSSEPGEEPVIVESLFSSSAERLFLAWTQPEEIVQWFGPEGLNLLSAKLDLRVNGQWEFIYPEVEGVQDIMTGRYLDIIQDARLVFTWQHVRKRSAASRSSPESLVTVQFEQLDQGSRLRLRHERVSREDARLGVSRGWSGSFVRLAAREGGTGQPNDCKLSANTLPEGNHPISGNAAGDPNLGREQKVPNS